MLPGTSSGRYSDITIFLPCGVSMPQPYGLGTARFTSCNWFFRLRLLDMQWLLFLAATWLLILWFLKVHPEFLAYNSQDTVLLEQLHWHSFATRIPRWEVQCFPDHAAIRGTAAPTQSASLDFSVAMVSYVLGLPGWPPPAVRSTFYFPKFFDCGNSDTYASRIELSKWETLAQFTVRGRLQCLAIVLRCLWQWPCEIHQVIGLSHVLELQPQLYLLQHASHTDKI